jgi:alcohol dehydrogenase
MREGLAQYGIDKKQFPSLAQEAAKQWTAGFNPRPIGAEDFERLYEEVFG